MTRTVSRLHIVSKRADTKYGSPVQASSRSASAVVLVLSGVFGDHWA